LAIIFGRTQLAVQTPFEPNRNPQWGGNAGPSGLVSIEAQSAIEEAKYTAPGTASRFLLNLTYQGGAANHWLQLDNAIGTDENPFIIAEPSTLRAL
jgi:hypothetical protein